MPPHSPPPPTHLPSRASASALLSQGRRAPRSHAETHHRDPRAGGRRLHLSRRPRTAERQPDHGVLRRGDLFGRGVGRHLCVLGVPDAVHAACDRRRARPDVRLHAAGIADDRGDVVMAQRLGAGGRRRDPAASRHHGTELHPGSRYRQHQRHRGSGPAAGYPAGFVALRQAGRCRARRLADRHRRLRHRGAASDADVGATRQSRPGSPGLGQARLGSVRAGRQEPRQDAGTNFRPRADLRRAATPLPPNRWR